MDLIERMAKAAGVELAKNRITVDLGTLVAAQRAALIAMREDRDPMEPGTHLNSQIRTLLRGLAD